MKLTTMKKIKSFISRNSSKLKAVCLILVLTALMQSGTVLTVFAAVQNGMYASPTTNGATTPGGGLSSAGTTTGGTTSGTTIFTVATNLLNNVQGQIIMLSTAAAGIAVGSGVFMKKFSMGKQDKMELGNKIIRDSIVGWFILNAITFILNYLGQFLH